MRELPEIETYRRDLERDVVGKKIKAADAESMALLPRYSNRKSFFGQLPGVKITTVARRGKTLVFGLDNEMCMVVVLGDTGRLRRNTNKAAVEDGTEITLTFTQHGQLRVIDREGNAEVFLIGEDEVDEQVPYDSGLDAIDETISWTQFGELLMTNDMKLKDLLCDSKVIVGLGDLYSDEILFAAGLRYDRVSSTLSTQEIRRLYRGLVETMHDAVKYRGTTLEEDDYTDLSGEPGVFGDHVLVYRKEGDLSPRSRAPIMRIKFNKRWVYYCETQM
jgi:formamidopyrimidine-DNA glycosylase